MTVLGPFGKGEDEPSRTAARTQVFQLNEQGLPADYPGNRALEILEEGG